MTANTPIKLPEIKMVQINDHVSVDARAWENPRLRKKMESAIKTLDRIGFTKDMLKKNSLRFVILR